MTIFPRGIVLPFQKGTAPHQPIGELQPAQPVRIPLLRPSEERIPTVSLAENAPVAAGEVLYLENEQETPALAGVAGTVSGTVVLNHPQYGELLCAELHPTGTATEALPVLPEAELTADAVIRIARQAAIYDELDGVPLWEKLRAWQLPQGDEAAAGCILVADATENDVFGSAAWAVLNNEPEACLDGLTLAAKALRFTRYHIATMLPKEQRRALKRAIGRVNVYTVADEYPVTVYADGNAEVFRIGIQACLALAGAVRRGEKQLGTVLSIAGDGVPQSRNLRVPFGTAIEEILHHTDADPQAQVVLGDAMTGVACADTRLPLLPGTTTLLVLKNRPVRPAQPCIGCGRCAAVCHAELLPYEIVRRLENMHYERLQHLSPWECDGCSACSYVCPAGRPVAAEVLRAGEQHGTVFLNWGDDPDE